MRRFFLGSDIHVFLLLPYRFFLPPGENVGRLRHPSIQISLTESFCLQSLIIPNMIRPDKAE